MNRISCQNAFVKVCLRSSWQLSTAVYDKREDWWVPGMAVFADFVYSGYIPLSAHGYLEPFYLNFV